MLSWAFVGSTKFQEMAPPLVATELCSKVFDCMFETQNKVVHEILTPPPSPLTAWFLVKVFEVIFAFLGLIM